jgi:uncharacterized repeat protein (TIGR01451 family)
VRIQKDFILNCRPANLVRLLLIVALLFLPVAPSLADLRAPAWYDSNPVTTAPDWHYRVPITIPAGTYANATIKFDADFTALLAQMNVTGTFDVNSPRIVRSTGALSTIQEYTDRIYGGATDSLGNARGEVRFLLEDSAGTASVTYYLYFDITENGAKPVNPQTAINGNFEKGVNGTAQPVGWNAPVKATAAYDASVRATEAPSILATPVSVEPPNPTLTDGSPLTGDFSYLYGWRANNAQPPADTTVAAPGVTFSRTIAVPATNPGSITFRYRPEGFDSSAWDYTLIDLVGATTVEMVGPNAAASSPATAGYALRPYSPALGSAVLSTSSTGYRAYNTFDCFLNSSVHTLTSPAMVVPCRSQQWITVTQSLAAFAGQTITFRARSVNDRPDQTWFSLDDVEWAVTTGTLGAPEAFGVNITLPATGGTVAPGQALPITAQVDANPTASTNPVTAEIYNSAGTLLAGGFILYNDGTHGDVTAGDAIWSNNNSVPAQPAPTVPMSTPTAVGYILRVFARDAATSGGLAHIAAAGAPQTQANFWNIDEITFTVQGAAISIVKSSSVVSDPVNGTLTATNFPKFIPGAKVRYCLLVTNSGPATAANIIMSDSLPTTLTYDPGSMKSGSSCATAATVEDDDNTGSDEADPFGSSYSAGSIITITTTLANAAVMALVFDAYVN